MRENVVFWELEIFGPEKDKWWIWGSETPKPPEMPLKLGKNVTTPQLASLHGSASNSAKIAIKQGKKSKRTNGTDFARPRGGVCKPQLLTGRLEVLTSRGQSMAVQYIAASQ